MDKNQSTPQFALFGRLVWMALGPGLLAITAIHIFLNGKGWHTPADYVFFATLAAMVLGRWLEILGGQPLNSDGEPATPKDFYRYVALVLGVGVALWVLANAFGNRGAGV
jgi:hypothetical protein